MTRRVYVTSAEKAAAKAVVKRTAAKGQQASAAVIKIANAARNPSMKQRSAR